MNRKILLSAFLIITPITTIVMYVLWKSAVWWDNNLPINFLMSLEIISFGLIYAFMRIFKEKIKSFYIFLFMFCGILFSVICRLFNNLEWQKLIIPILFYSVGIFIIPALFAWVFCAVKNKYIKTGFALTGLFYIHLIIINQSFFEWIEWIMYIVVLFYGIRTFKKHGIENKKLIFYPLLALGCFNIFGVAWRIFECALDGGNCLEVLYYPSIDVFYTINILSIWLAYICGFWFVKTKKLFVKIILPVLLVLLALFLLKFLRIEIVQKFEKGAFTGGVSIPAKLSELKFYTDSTMNNTVTINDLDKKVYVLDFSNPGCGVCFREMPKFQKLMERHENKTEIGFYTVYVYNDTSDIAKFQKYVEKRNITVPHLFIDRKDSLYIKNFNYQAFPQYNIVQNDTIIFNGFFDILDIFEQKYLK